MFSITNNKVLYLVCGVVGGGCVYE